MSQFNAIQKHLFDTIPKISKFLQIELRAEFSVIDYSKLGTSCIVPIQSDNTYTIRQNEIEIVAEDFFDPTKLFKVSQAKTMGFIPIDGKKGLLGFGTSHCDFVLFDEHDFCFVELKLNAEEISEDNKDELRAIRKIRKNREKAKDQLSNTIDWFDNQLAKNYEGLTLEAYVCTPQSYPRQNAAWEALATAFLEKYGFHLFEENSKVCK